MVLKTGCQKTSHSQSDNCYFDFNGLYFLEMKGEAESLEAGRFYLHFCFPRLPSLMAVSIWSEWRLTVITATVRIALVDILDLSEFDIPAGVFLHPAVGWG